MNNTNDGPTLLDAVDELTKPVALVRFKGTDHDHDWLDLVRDLTPEERLLERALAKKENRKPARTMKTGEHWCPWCDVVVDERPGAVDDRTISRHDDPPLLDQLAACIGTTLGDGGTRGANTGGSPIDVAAYEKHKEIDAEVRRWMLSLGARPGKDLSLAQLVRSWYTLRLAGVTTEGEDYVFRVKLSGWRTDILDILDPPTQIPYMGQPCPICGETRAIRTFEGDTDSAESTVALWAFLRPAYREEGSYGICKACNTILAKDADPLMLRGKMNGAIRVGKPGLVYSAGS